MSRSNQVVCGPTEKSQNSNLLVDDEDLFSNLPDSLISQILSCLPTKDAIRTSVLSKDWEWKWTSIYNFDILHDNSEEQESNFVNFVERILLHADHIRCLELTFFTECDTSQFTSWISAAVRRKIEILKFDYAVGVPYGGEKQRENDDWHFCLPNNCSLRKLTAISMCFQFPTGTCLTNLTTLELSHVLIMNESSSTSHLRYTFPVLKTLEMTGCIWLKAKLVEIHAPELTRFISRGDTRILAEADDGYSFKVIADKLEELHTSCHLPDEVIVTGSRVVAAAFRYMGPTDGDDQVSRKKGLQVRMLLKGFSRLMKLQITNSTVEAMGKWKQQFPLPRFVKLAQLELCPCVSSEGLLELLHAAPYLKFLSIIVNTYGSWKNGGYDEVESVPSCVESHLEEVLFTYTQGEDPQYHLEKFILKNGGELKKFHVHNRRLESNEILKKFYAFPKVSTSLTFSTPGLAESLKLVEEWGYRY